MVDKARSRASGGVISACSERLPLNAGNCPQLPVDAPAGDGNPLGTVPHCHPSPLPLVGGGSGPGPLVADAVDQGCPVVPASGGCSKHFEGEDFLKTLSGTAGGFWGAWAVCGSCGRFRGALWSLWQGWRTVFSDWRRSGCAWLVSLGVGRETADGSERWIPPCKCL